MTDRRYVLVMVALLVLGAYLEGHWADQDAKRSGSIGVAVAP